MNQPAGQKPGPAETDWDDDGPWRHPPVAPRDADAADSLGKAVSDVVTGPLESDPVKAVLPATAPLRKP